MRIGLQIASVVFLFGLGTSCTSDPFPKNFDADKKSGPDGKRSGAQVLPLSRAKTDEVTYAHQDRTDWYVVSLSGPPNVLALELHWDNAKSDLMVDVFDEFGKQLSASPSRSPGVTQKTLLTQIDQPSVYYIRISAPRPEDSSVYTVEAKWDAPQEIAMPQRPREIPHIIRELPQTHVKREPHEPRDAPPPKERAPAETIQGHIVGAYREAGALMLHIDKGASAGVKAGMSGNVLVGPTGEESLRAA